MSNPGTTAIPEQDPVWTPGTTAIPDQDPVWTRCYHDVTPPTPPQQRDSKLSEKCDEVTDVLRRTAIARDIPLKERDWQIESCSWLLLGYDVSVVAATSDGKSFCYQLLALVALGSCVLVVSPLVALISDQVSYESCTQIAGYLTWS